MSDIPEEVRHLYPNHTAAASVEQRHQMPVAAAGNNDNDNDDDIYPRDDEQHDDDADDGYDYEFNEEEEDELDNLADDDPILQDEQLYNEVLAYLMKGAKTDYAGSPVHQMPSALSRVLGERRVRIESEPRDIVPGPVQLIDLPPGLALLFDVATDESYRERWATRQLEPFKAVGAAAAVAGAAESGGADSGESKERRLIPEGDGAAAAESSSGTPEKKEGEDSKKEGEEEKKDDESGGDKKKDDEEAGGGDGEDDGNHKKKHGRRTVVKGHWGGEKKELPPAQKKFSTLHKPPPRPNVDFQLVSDINEGLKLPGPPQWVPYIAYLCALPPPRPDRCLSLYESGVTQIDNHAQREKERKAKKEEEELKQCTFAPEVSAAVKKMRGWKGDMVKFYSDKLDWVKQMERKMEKKKLKEEKEREELYVQWSMPDKSKKILERRDRRLTRMGQEGDLTPARAADRRGVEVVSLSADQSPASQQQRSISAYSGGVAAQAEGGDTGFTPVTNSHRFKHLAVAKDGRSVSSGGDGGGGGGEQAYNFTAILDEFSPPEELVSGELTQKQFLSRMNEDLQGREERKKQRAIQFARQQREKLFDPVTGQPLFEPNSAPTIIRQDGQRVSFGELSSKEKKDLIRRLKQRGRLDFVPGVARRSALDAHTVDDEEVQSMYKRMLEKVRQGNVRIDRIRRREDQELTKLFRPTIDKRTAKMVAQQGAYRKPVYNLPLPTKPAPPPPKPKPKSDPSKMASVAERNILFQSTKMDAVQRKRDEKEEKDKKLTFQPAVSPASNRIVAERRGQWQKEIATLEQRREEWRAQRQGGEIHYASEVTDGGSAAPGERQRSTGSHHGSGGGSKQGSPPNGGNNFHQQPHYYDPVAEQHKQREVAWTRPEARKVANHYYFEAEHPQRRPSPTLLGGSGQVAAAIAARHGGGGGSDPAQKQRVAGFQQPQSQSQQPQQQQQQQGGAGYDDIDALVGSMLQGKGSPATQQQQQQQQQQQPGANATQSLKFSSSPNGSSTNERSVSEQQRLAALARARQQKQSHQQQAQPAVTPASPSDDGSGRRLRSILASWDDLERQTEAALGF